MEEKDFKKFMLPALILCLAVLSFLIIKPISTSVFLGLLLAYLFYNPFSKLAKKLKSETAAGLVIVLGTCVVIFVPLILLIPTFIKQLFQAYMSFRSMDLASVAFRLFPQLSSSPEMASQISSTLSHFNTKISDVLNNIFQSTLVNIPEIMIGLVVVMFTFYFGLMGGEIFKDYVSAAFTIPNTHKQRLFEKFSQVTDSVLYSHLIIGIIQGIIGGIGYYMFGIPNALLLTILTAIVGVLPVLGPWLVWIPACAILLVTGNDGAAVQLLIYNLVLVTWSDTLLRPFIVAQKAEMNAALVLIGAIGGTYAFGMIGFILGPLVLAYLILLIEMYKDNNEESIVIVKEEGDKKDS